MNKEKKSLRKRLVELAVGESLIVKREEHIPSTVRTTAYHVGYDYNIKFSVHVHDFGIEVERVA